MSRPRQVTRDAGRRSAAGRRAVLFTSCALASAAIAVGLWQEAKNPRFAVDIVSISGLEHTPPGQVVAAADLGNGQNAWMINRGALARRLEALPWVASVSLHVTWPNRLAIDVTERRPVAQVALAPLSGNARPPAPPSYAAIDASQRVLEVTHDRHAFGSLPILAVTPPPTGNIEAGAALDRAEVGAALDAYRRLSAFGLTVSEVAIAPSTGISATADRNMRVLFGEDEDLARKAQLFQAIVAKISTPSRIAYVDVRSVRAPTVLYR